MALHDTEAIILKTYSLAEADRIVVFLTEDHGVVRGVAKGVKRLKSRFGGSIEPFTIVRLTYYRRDALELVSVKNVELIESFFSSAADPAFFQKFTYLAEALLALTPPEDPNETLYRLVRSSLRTAAGDPGTIRFLGLYFELWLLKLGGYLPNWARCDECKRELREDSNLQINFHLLCRDCRRTSSDVVVSGPQRELFNSAQRLSPPNFARLAADHPGEIEGVSEILRRIISQVIGRQLTPEKSLVAGS